MATPPLLWSRMPTAGYFINSVSISANGQRIAAGTFFHDYSQSSADASAARRLSSEPDETPSQFGEFGTYVWDAAGNLLMSQVFEGWQGVYWVDLAADGTSVASCGWYQALPAYTGFIGACDVSTGTPTLFYKVPKRGNMVSLNANGTVLVAAADQGYVFVRAPGLSFAAPQILPLTNTSSSEQALVALVDAEGKTGAILSYHGEVIVFSMPQQQITTVQRWQVPNSAYVHAGAMSADGRYLFVGANDGTLYALEVASFLSNPQPAWSNTMPDSATTIYGVTCNDDGSLVGAAANLHTGGVVAIFSNQGQSGPLQWQSTTTQSPNGVSMDATGAYFAAAEGHSSSGGFSFWQPPSTTPTWFYPTSEMCWPIDIAANASLIAAGSDDGNVYLFQGPATS